MNIKNFSIIILSLLIGISSSNVLSMYGYSRSQASWLNFDRSTLTQMAICGGVTAGLAAFLIFAIREEKARQKALMDKKFPEKIGMYLVKAKGCRACDRVEPIVKEHQNSYKDQLTIKIIDVDTANQLGIPCHSYPTVAYINNHKMFKTQSGANKITFQSTKSTLDELLDIAAKNDFGVSLERPVDVAIIGAGPAGCSAASYAARNNLKTVLFGKQAKSSLAGVQSVNNWPGASLAPSGSRLSFDLYNQAMQAGADVNEDTIVKIDKNTFPLTLISKNGKQYFSKSVILATGRSPVKPTIAGIEKYWGKGVAICALCDAASYKGKKVIVWGQHNVDETLQHLGQVAERVTLVIQEKDIINGSTKELIEQYNGQQKHKIVVLKNANIKEIKGNDSTITDVKISKKINGDKEEVEFTLGGRNAVFLGLGSTPNNELARNLGLELEDGYVKTNPLQETSTKGIFAIGDITHHRYKQAFLGASQGITGAMSAFTYINKK